VKLLNQNDNAILYMFAAVFSAIAGLSFLIAGYLGGFNTIYFVFSVLFVLNSFLFFSLGKMKTRKNENIC